MCSLDRKSIEDYLLGSCQIDDIFRQAAPIISFNYLRSLQSFAKRIIKLLKLVVQKGNVKEML